MKANSKKAVHKRLKNRKGTNAPKTDKKPVVVKYEPVPHKIWVRPNYSEAHRMYVLKQINAKGKTLIVMYRSNKESLEGVYNKLINAHKV